MLCTDHSSWFWFLVTILVVWRITTLVCYESGPFKVLVEYRRLMFRIGLGNMISCFHCTAVWISAIVIALVYPIGAPSLILAIAVAGGASIIETRLAGQSSRGESEAE